MWVFGFGSLTFDGWQFKFGCAGRQRATLVGYRRAFNKKSVINWGTKASSGITLNLQPSEGDKCVGIAFEFPTDSDGSVLLGYLRKREGCGPTELPIQLSDGRSVPALVYIYQGSNLINPATSVTEKAAMIRNARGTSGSAIEYVRRNFEGLQAEGLEDRVITELWEAIQKRSCP